MTIANDTSARDLLTFSNMYGFTVESLIAALQLLPDKNASVRVLCDDGYYADAIAVCEEDYFGKLVVRIEAV